MPTDTLYRSLTSTEDWQEVLERSTTEPVLIYKHSAVCPISARSDRELAELNGPGAPPIYKLVVQKSRALSNTIADSLGVRHETPQVILLEDREPVFDASHYAVKADAIRDALSRTATSH